MELKKETEKLTHRLNTARMRGEIDFTGVPDVQKQSGNTYVEVECTDQERANTVQEKLEKIDLIHYTETGQRNTVDSIYVYIVAHNSTLDSYEEFKEFE